MIQVAPSILSANFARLEQDIRKVEPEVSRLHVDVMDGVFVPNISIGIPVVRDIRKVTQLTLDVHLMIVHPERYLESFAQAGADILCVHFETCPHLHRVIQQIHALGVRAMVALNPHTPVAFLQDILPELDGVLIMSVNPGFGGQEFIRSSLARIRRLSSLAQSLGCDFEICVDGGVNQNTAVDLVEAGAQVLVAGSAVFGASDPAAAVRNILDRCRNPT
ncbi:MAG TPA: ribulose-phosphate 3-epimerase [Thermotogota bacterium]|nr:ribulose-phosphate 3-epimerase [Thermotogota bacterium]HRW91967.1 ribulose-phosphate 3-epimerase [Thermotogota bacterium]